MARIVVVGSVAQDDALTLRQPLAAGRHLDAASRRVRLGGGGANTAIPLRHAGHQVTLVAPVGADDVAEWLLARAAGGGGRHRRRSPGSPATARARSCSWTPEGERTIVNLHRCRERRPPARLAALDADAVYVRSRDLDLREPLEGAAGRSLVVAHVPPLEAGSRPAHVLVGSESDLPPAFLADPWAAGRAIAGEPPAPRGRDARGARRLGVLGPRADRRARPAGERRGLDRGRRRVRCRPRPRPRSRARPTRAALETAVAWGAAAVACPGVPSRETIEGLL